MIDAKPVDQRLSFSDLREVVRVVERIEPEVIATKNITVTARALRTLGVRRRQMRVFRTSPLLTLGGSQCNSPIAVSLSRQS
jgi:hypothetical protein